MELVTNLDEMPEDAVVTSRTLTSPIHDLLATLANDEKYHKSLRTLAAFKLPQEKGKAHQQKQNLTNAYGNTPAISGFEFVVTRAVDNSTEYLGVIFDPDKIVAGEYEKFAKRKAEKQAAAKERKALRDEKAAAKAEIDALENAS